jgi:hypothetical protein
MPELLLSQRLFVWTLLTVAALAAVARPAAAAEADTTPPVLAVPKDMRYQLKQQDAIVRMTWKVGVQDETDQHPRVNCLPRSGSVFKVGTTKVTCTATDAAGNHARDSFRITVTKRRAAAQPATRTPRLTVRAYRPTTKGTELLGVKVTGVVKGAVVTVTCDPHCPGALATPTRHTSTGRTLSLAGLFRGAHLKAGTTVRVSGAGISSRIRIRANRPPLVLR